MPSCTNCLNNCGDNIITDKCTVYTGDDIPLLGICNGDTLYQWEAAIVSKLEDALAGTSITLSTVTLGCSFLTDALAGKDKTLVNLIQLLLDNQCTLKSLIPVTATPTFNLQCLSSLPASPTTDQVLQAVVDKLCAYVTKVDAIEEDYVKASQLNTLIAQYNTSISGSIVQEYTKMPKYVALPYHGPLSNFDGSGKGLVSAGYDKVYICNGSNGTPDYAGRSPIGANSGVVHPLGMDTKVDPVVTGIIITAGNKYGEFNHALTPGEGPVHSHIIIDPGHSHNTKYTGIIGNVDHSNGSQDFFFDNPTAGNYNSGFVLSQKTGITIQSSGSGTPHNTIHPSMGCVFIMYIP